MKSEMLGSCVYIDESYGEHKERKRFSVLVGSILSVSPVIARERIGDFHLGINAFKTAKAAGNRRYAKIAKGLDWTQRCTAHNFAVISFHKSKQSEQMRHESLAILLLALADFPLRTITFDSRSNPGAKNPGQVNLPDIHSVRRMKTSGLISRNVEIFHKTDEEDNLLFIPDLLAWTIKNHVEGKYPQFWELIEAKTSLISI